MRLVCPQLVEEKLLPGGIIKSFGEIQAIEVFFASTYKTTAKIDRGYAGKIIFVIVGIRYACFRVSFFFNAAVTLILSDCGFCLKCMLELYITCLLLW